MKTASLVDKRHPVPTAKGREARNGRVTQPLASLPSQDDPEALLCVSRSSSNFAAGIVCRRLRFDDGVPSV